MPSADYDDFTFTIARGDDRTISMTVDADITGVDLWFTGKRRLDNDAEDTSAIFQYTVGSGITVTDAASGEVEIALDGTDTDALTADTAIFCDLQCKDGDAVWTAATGKITVFRDVTRGRV